MLIMFGLRTRTALTANLCLALGALGSGGVASALLSSGSAFAADLPGKVAVVETQQACKATLSTPAFGPTIKQNADPLCVTLPGLGDIYVGAAFSGYAYHQTNPFPFALSPVPGEIVDRSSRLDFTNLQAWIQKADGPFQFFVQGGAYSIPGLGLPLFSAMDQTDLLFGPLPVAFGKVVFNDNWSIQGGRMPTLIGSEAPFTFQNINVSRGLLFNQENVINHGVQVNYANGPWSVSVAGTDGFFSGELTWFTGAVTYKVDDNNTFGINGGVNLGRQNVFARSLRYQFATLPLQQNSGILSVNYTYANGPWTITPYLQYTNVEADPAIGIPVGASTYGGAVLAAYAFNDNFSLGSRVEYISQSGRPGGLAPSLLYGPGSSAFSFTITPTYTINRFFVRGEYAHVELFDITRGDLALATNGSGFGRNGNQTSQERFMLETGITF
jgi:hypothetical protein